MEPIQTTASLIRHPGATAFSALPTAPVVPDREHRTVGIDSRARLARVLHRLADAVAPASPARGAWASR